jgi:hypothetical protein
MSKRRTMLNECLQVIKEGEEGNEVSHPIPQTPDPPVRHLKVAP